MSLYANFYLTQFIIIFIYILNKYNFLKVLKYKCYNVRRGEFNMEIQRKKNENNNNYNYYLINNNNKVEINYASDNDLFFITSSKKEQIEFYITKDNMFIYNLFDLLFKSFEDASLFQISYKQLLKYCDIESQIKLYKKITEANQRIKDSYLYQKLFANNKIVWISDDSISFDEQTADTMVSEGRRGV